MTPSAHPVSVGMDLEATGTRVREAERRVERRVGEARAILLEGKKAEEEVAALEERQAVLDEVIGLLNSYADEQQQVVQTKIEALVSHGLRLIFDDQDMEFHLQVGQKGKYATTDFVVRTTTDAGTFDTPVMDARGGGVAAVVGFILRVVLLLLRPGARKVLFLDESFAQLSAEYEPRLADFLKELTERTDVQLVLVTHSNAFGDVADVEYRFRLEDGVTVVEKA